MSEEDSRGSSSCRVNSKFYRGLLDKQKPVGTKQKSTCMDKKYQA